MTIKRKRYLVALEGGGDWTDASVTYLSIPVDVNISAVKVAWRNWYQTYQPGRDRFICLTNMLVEQYGATLNPPEITIEFDDA